MSTYLYKALTEANASDATATEAAHEIDTYRQDVLALKTLSISRWSALVY